MLEALEALSRRSLIERGQGASFTLQAVVMEYVTDALLDQLSEEIRTIRRWTTCTAMHVEQAQAKDYVRQTQVRLLVRPLLERLRAELGSDARIEEQCLSLLRHVRTEDGNSQGYGPANVISSAQSAAERPARPGSLTARHSWGVLARGPDARRDACRGRDA